MGLESLFYQPEEHMYEAHLMRVLNDATEEQRNIILQRLSEQTVFKDYKFVHKLHEAMKRRK